MCAPIVLKDAQILLSLIGLGRLGMTLERHRDREHADLDVALGEDAHQAPEARATAVLVHGLDLDVANALQRHHGRHFLQEDSGIEIAEKINRFLDRIDGRQS